MYVGTVGIVGKHPTTTSTKLIITADWLLKVKIQFKIWPDFVKQQKPSLCLTLCEGKTTNIIRERRDERERERERKRARRSNKRSDDADVDLKMESFSFTAPSRYPVVAIIFWTENSTTNFEWTKKTKLTKYET